VRGELQRGHAGVDAYRVLQLQQLGSWQFGNVFFATTPVVRFCMAKL